MTEFVGILVFFERPRPLCDNLFVFGIAKVWLDDGDCSSRFNDSDIHGAVKARVERQGNADKRPPQCPGGFNKLFE